ncbi:XTP/dITP diphosphatase [Dethiobacter alkaliphilus]|uniref:dITP/XTP pyrophosphatase n=1 Tax=Dethiobacter alkaliphilus AHT 1 TaxID=555088 RepID=C0GEZ8_DETAL|nr:XTP/dITP diphosphatase [Dethiobacter alkaliphilus]EEG78180.1 non-canonical purine NTP pyrophosphatase, rdgB/HAM1 family [Dethiobacter alkaliphilus AHT 1]
MKLIIASRNEGKLREFAQLLADSPLEPVSLSAYPNLPEIEETGSTFRENAALKAETVARLTGEWALADDSGLEVDALGGEPGVYSARYAGEGQGDEANNKKLLDKLADVPEEKRTARFRAVIAIARPGKDTQFAEGAVEGIIAFSPQGSGGFGYDPLFLVPHTGKTFAQMTGEEKNRISHRARAMEQAMKILKQIASEGQ